MAEQKFIQIEISRKLKDSMMVAAEKVALNKDSKISSGRAALNALKKSSKVRPLVEFIGENDDVGIVILEENSETARIIISKEKINQEIVTENGKVVKNELTTADGTPIIDEKQEKKAEEVVDDITQGKQLNKLTQEVKEAELKETWTYTNPTTKTTHNVGIDDKGQIVVDMDGQWEVIDDEEDKKIILQSKPKKLGDLTKQLKEQQEKSEPKQKKETPEPEPKQEKETPEPEPKQEELKSPTPVPKEGGEGKKLGNASEDSPAPKEEGGKKGKEVSGDAHETITLLKIIAKNFGSIPWMARDLNVARQNAIKLVKIGGGEATNKADAMFMKEGELEKKLETDQEKYGKKSKSPEQVKNEENVKKGKDTSLLRKALNSKFLKDTKVGKGLTKALDFKDSLLKSLSGLFKPANFLKALGKIALPLLVITTLFQGFMAGWDAWKETGSIWEAFKATVGGMVEFLTFGFIDKEMVSNMYDWAFDAITGLMQTVANFFGFGDFFAEKLAVVKDFLGVGVKPKKNKETADPKELKEATKKSNRIGHAETVNEKGETVTTTERKGQYKELPKTEVKPKPTPIGPVKRKGAIGVQETVGGAAPPPSTEPTKEGKVPVVGADDKWIMDMIKKHEGVRTKPYKDSLGLWTIGVGHLIGDGKSLPPEWNREFTMAEVDALFAKDFEEHKKAAEKIPGYDKANKATQGALIDLTFNMGAAWYKKWPNFIKALVAGNMQQAAEELQNSKWYQQVKGRASDIVALIKSGGSSPTAVAETKPMTDKAPTASGAPSPGGSTETASGGGSLGSVATVQSGVDISGFKSEFEKRVASMAAAFKEKTGKALLITSGYRSNEKQKQLWDQALAANGGNEAVTRKKVAEPMPPLGNGKGSFHLKGLAIDINSKGDGGLNALAGSRDAPTGWLEKFGLTRPVPGEDWHVQATGLAPTADNPANPGAPTMVADKDGKPMDVNSGKKETLPSATPAAASAPSGGSISTASTQLASDQRCQCKPTTPMIVNAPVTTTNIQKTSQVKPYVDQVVDMGKEAFGWAC